jgi:exodeoxyribonuclease VII small subunit
MTLTADRVILVTDGSTDAANGSPARAGSQRAGPQKAGPGKTGAAPTEAGATPKEAGATPKEAGATPKEAGVRKADAAPKETLSYEQARDKLAAVVKRLEAGGLTLEQSLELWERGERLAAVCGEWLDGARARLAAAMAKRDDADQDGADRDGEDAPF